MSVVKSLITRYGGASSTPALKAPAFNISTLMKEKIAFNLKPCLSELLHHYNPGHDHHRHHPLPHRLRQGAQFYRKFGELTILILWSVDLPVLGAFGPNVVANYNHIDSLVSGPSRTWRLWPNVAEKPVC